MFYDVFVSLCNKKGVAPTRAALDIGLSKSTPTTWKKRGLTPQGETLNKIADYFEVSVDYLLGNEQKEISQIENEDLQLRGTYLRLAKGAQELGLDDEDVDTILALYKKHRRNNDR